MIHTFIHQRPSTAIAYLLTPGLAPVQADSPLYGTYPAAWAEVLQGCVSDRQLLWGGVSQLKRQHEQAVEFALLPQRAFVPPGTVYAFGKQRPKAQQLLPQAGGSWLETLQKLSYGQLLWGQH